MKKFLAVYMGSPPDQGNNDKWSRLSDKEQEETIQRGMQAWGAWMTEHQKRILDIGGPLGKTKSASDEGVKDITNAMTGYVIFNAESHQAAVELFENHPHFSIFPGDSVEVMEILPMPRGA